ncbi:hypothetical protein HNR37_001994 [Desulfurispira natronophila]|uniref:Uncharacterized protein n=1 Tax=Desulfurispira natronophila TaxID=682562 RepID=A0A7W7Y5V2_9BACT|nr:hypothetical protein [Desulfurispira natronophila]
MFVKMYLFTAVVLVLSSKNARMQVADLGASRLVSVNQAVGKGVLNEI